MLPLYVEARNLGLVGSRLGMIVVYTGVLLPLSVFLDAGFLRTLAPEYGRPRASTVRTASRPSCAWSSRPW